MVGVGEGLRRVPETARHTSSCISAAVCSWRTGPRRWLPRTVGVEHKLLTQDSRLLLFLCNVMKTVFLFFQNEFLDFLRVCGPWGVSHSHSQCEYEAVVQGKCSLSVRSSEKGFREPEEL